jgi:hypothetical protein
MTTPRMGDETVQVLEWAYATLTGSQALATAIGVALSVVPARVWADVAPGTAAEPFAVYSAGDSTDYQAMGLQDRLATTVPLTVRWVAQGRAFDPLVGVVRATYDLLHGAADVGLAGGGRILTCQRVRGIAYVERSDGIDYRNLGHVFDVVVN